MLVAIRLKCQRNNYYKDVLNIGDTYLTYINPSTWDGYYVHIENMPLGIGLMSISRFVPSTTRDCKILMHLKKKVKK